MFSPARTYPPLPTNKSDNIYGSSNVRAIFQMLPSIRGINL